MRPDRHLIHYGMVMGVRYLNTPEGELLDALELLKSSSAVKKRR
jgi:hypothetical protein